MHPCVDSEEVEGYVWQTIEGELDNIIPLFSSKYAVIIKTNEHFSVTIQCINLIQAAMCDLLFNMFQNGFTQILLISLNSYMYK